MTDRYINIDIFLKDMERLYKKAGWDENEVHFSLLDLKCNLDGLPCIEVSNTRLHTLKVKTISFPEGEKDLIKDCDTCKYGFVDEQFNLPLCHIGAEKICENWNKWEAKECTE